MNPLGLLVILLSLAVSLMLMMLPLPDWALPYRPDFMALTLIYWSLALPTRIGLWVAFVCGLFVDVTTASLLGQHALALVVILFINLNVHQRIRVMTVPHQALYVLVLLMIDQVLVLMVEGMIGRQPPLSALVGAPLIGMLLWPWIFLLLRALRRRVHLA
jgi:rod shape-determining protein MreD